MTTATAPARLAIEDIPPAFGHWLAGLADGEGCLRAMGFTARQAVRRYREQLMSVREYQAEYVGKEDSPEPQLRLIAS